MPTLLPHRNRSDRTVRHLRLRLAPGASSLRTQSLLEEALRLAALPGEDQGRVYFFRHLSLQIPSPNASRSLWLTAIQTALQNLAAQAVHATDHRANTASAVCFRSDQEALEWLLGRILHHPSPTPAHQEWFAALMLGAPSSLDPVQQAIVVIERLRLLPAQWFAAASAMLASLEHDTSSTLSLLARMPIETLSNWLHELGGKAAISASAPSLSASKTRLLLRCIAYLRDTLASPAQDTPLASPAVQPPILLLWLATLFVIAERPSCLAGGTPALCAAAVIHEAVSKSSHGLRFLENPDQPPAKGSSPHREPPSLNPPPSTLDLSLGTQAAGLYFLLNVLARLGIEKALRNLPDSHAGQFLPRLLQSLAAAANVPADDPALLWADLELAGAPLPQGSIDAYRSWPNNLLPPANHLPLHPARLLRVWTVAVRRWCWLAGRLTLGEIVQRQGRILLTCVDLDVTLPLDSADVRLRRIGLDLDPGWLPWFGRVVRFHYTAGGQP